MMLASLGQPSEADLFAYFLAETLGRTVGELQEMPADEYAGWQSYFKVKRNQEDLAMMRARRGVS